MGDQEISFNGDCDIHRPLVDMTKHAKTRVQQRGVNPAVLDCLLAYGHHEPDHKGCQIVTFDCKAFEDLARFESRLLNAKACDCRSLYAVVDSDGVVITTGHRFRRVPRDLSLASYRPGRHRSQRALKYSASLLPH